VAKYVRVLNVTDGCIPSGQAEDVEEKRRLLHVAMTRAKRELDLIVPQRLSKFHNSKLAKQGGFGAVSRLFRRAPATHSTAERGVTGRLSGNGVDLLVPSVDHHSDPRPR
jgi:superfamily I DNA/RNA helicase